ncbi:hypothetical protein LRR80_02015 [Streptomyces sp. RO-S4]|nr:hypothetical protein [Streptomyces sp. RO-S4]
MSPWYSHTWRRRCWSPATSGPRSPRRSTGEVPPGSVGSGATAGADDAAPLDAVADGSAGADALGAELDAEGDGEADALALADGESEAEGDTDGDADEAPGDGSADADPDGWSGTLALMSSGAALSRDGES